MVRTLAVLPLLVSLGCNRSTALPDPENPAPSSEKASVIEYWGSPAQDDFEGATTRCFYSARRPNVPAAVVQYKLETLATAPAVHLRLTFDPAFVDNTYGAEAVGWQGAKSKKHTFTDLVGSDHAQLALTDSTGATALEFKLDYISAQANAASKYATLGVSGGDGKMLKGSAPAILKTLTSLDRNLNERGYSMYTTSSPATDSRYKANPAAPNWDFRVVYESWIDNAAFGAAGFGSAKLTSVHASPSKTGNNTELVEDRPCPPSWNTPAPGLKEGAGGQCTLASDCLSGSCLDGYCAKGEPGTDCRAAFDCASGSCENGLCEGAGGGDGGAQPTSPTNTGAPGSACTVDRDCASEACSAQLCEKSAPGFPCRADADCTNNLCSDGYCRTVIN